MTYMLLYDDLDYSMATRIKEDLDLADFGIEHHLEDGEHSFSVTLESRGKTIWCGSGGTLSEALQSALALRAAEGESDAD